MEEVKSRLRFIYRKTGFYFNLVADYFVKL